MKSFKRYISEAVATRKKPTRAEKNEFADKFDKVLYSKAFGDLQHKRYLHKWHITGHNPGTQHGTNKAIEAVKEKVFGKRRKGTSDLLWMHHKHGLVTHPAIGDVTHMDVQDNYRPRKGIKVNKKIQAKVMEGGSGGILGRGRIEHHEGGGGIISYSHGGIGSRAAAVRTIARAYPKYKIHDGQGNLLEGYTTTKDGWLHSRALGRRRWMKGSHSIERQGKRGWTVYDWHASKELHVAKTARDAKAWSEKNRSTAAPTHEPINIRLFENWSYAHDFHEMPNSEKQKYVYHVTTAARAAKIVKHGLRPRNPRSSGNYPDLKDHTKGHAFVTNHHGVPYWERQTETAVNRGEVNVQKRKPVHILKFPLANMKKSTRRKLRLDTIGSEDAREHDEDPLIDPSSHEASTALKIRKKINEDVQVKSFMRYINEAKEETITDFVRFAARQLGLQQEPNIEFVDVRDGSMTTAAYCPSDCSMKIYRGNRATFDICRSIAHEMVHQMQDENGDELDGTTGSPCEDEANAVAGRLIRMYGSENDSFYEE